MTNLNLYTRSSYTFFNSLLKIDNIVELAIRNNFGNAFLIDKNTMYGAMEFYTKCAKNNIKPIIGLEIDYQNINEILIANNYLGYQELMKISSTIMLEEQLDLKIFDLSNITKIDFDIKPVLYKEAKDIKTLKEFNQISNSQNEFNEDSTHFLSSEEFKEMYKTETVEKIEKIVLNNDLKIKEHINVLPSYKVDGEVVNSDEYLEKELKAALKILLTNYENLDKKLYIERTSYEIKIIKKMGFSSYFLIVADIINWSKKQGIFVGPGRGSAPGSIVSFLLNITTIDPIKNNLIFERFLNPERISMPDIDIDFEDARREEAIEYIVNKYGHDKVAQIITYQTLRAKMSFKDIARIKNISASETNLITKLIPDDLTLEEAYNKSKTFRNRIDSSEVYKEIFDSAKLIEGLPRQYSTHAAGVVLSDKPIVDSVPVQKGYGNSIQTQYSMDYMETNGLLKIDFLGLRNLTFIKDTLSLIKKNKNISIDIEKITFDDPNVYKLFSNKKTSGIFQLESSGMKNALKEINVSSFEDVVATTSLFRPGPVKMIPEFAARKKGNSKIEYLNADIEKILKPTYGIIVYQEQIIQIVQTMSNFTLSKADILRRAIGKKNIELLESMKNDFFEGALSNGYTKNEIQKMYDLIYEFSNYGFNRSHAFAYTVISYWLGWLKINYPIEFMCSLLNSVIGNVTKTPDYILEAQEMNIKINEPDIFNSSSDYTIKNNEIYIGLKSIKKIGDAAIKQINLSTKNLDKDNELIDFFIEFHRQGLTVSTLSIFIKAGLLNKFNYNKETLLFNLKKIYEYIELIKINNDGNITYNKALLPKPKIIEQESENDYTKEVLGFSLNTTKSLNTINEIVNKLKLENNDLNDLNDKDNKTFIAEFLSIRVITTKTGKKMAFANLTNGNRKVNVTFWPAVYDKFSNLLEIGKMYQFYGTVDLSRNETIIINKMEVINE